jgi:deoxyribonuclease-4
MSIGGGLHRAVDRAGLVDATALQVFVKSSRQWAARPLEPGEIDAFRRRVTERGMAAHTLAHATYLINLATPEEALWTRSVAAFVLELERCERLGIPYLVVHPGAHVGAGEEAGMARVARALGQALRSRRRRSGARRAAPVRVLLETTAGQGTNLGHRFEQLAWIIDRSEVGERLGACFDTCHVLAAGYDIRDARSWRATLAEFDRTLGLARLKAFHLNDSKHGPGSRKDRHEHIGRGQLGLEPFRLILNDPRFRELPMVLETPKGDDLAEDRENLAVLRSLVGRTRR